MSLTPVAIIGSKHPEYLKDVQKLTKKWEKRTKGLQSAWPREGTFDLTVCENLEQRIMDYKAKQKTKKRLNKRELELAVVNLFKVEGQCYMDNLKAGLSQLGNKKDKAGEDKKGQAKKEKEAETGSKVKKSVAHAGIYPSLVGRININGDFEYDNKTKQQGEVSNGADEASFETEPETRHDGLGPGLHEPGPAHGSGVPTSGSLLGSGRNQTLKDKSPLALSAVGKFPLKDNDPPPQYCSTAKKETKARRQSGVNLPSIIDCFAERNDTLRSGAAGQSYWVNLENRGLDLRREMCRSIIQEIESEIEEREKELAEPDGIRGGEGSSSKSQKSGADERYDLRLRPAISRPDRYTDGMYPILIKGVHATYVPWATTDLAGLIARLPQLDQGAGKWIRAFEEETVGKMLAIGDMKALLAQLLGTKKMEEIVQKTRHEWMMDAMADGTEFNAYRAAFWGALRSEFPNRADPQALKGEPLMETESPGAYIAKQLRRWRQEMEEDIENSPMLTSLFRNSVVEALPVQVRSRLEEVVGLTSMPHDQFRDNVVHAIEKHRREEQRLVEQEKSVQRKLAQLQLGELQGKTKAKTQGVAAETGESTRVIQATQTVQPMAAQTPRIAEGTLASGAPVPQVVVPPQRPQVVNVYPGPQNAPASWNRPRYGGERPGGGPGRGGGPDRKCWTCGQSGHFAASCSARGRGRRPQPMQRSGPVNTWARQSFD